MHDYLLQFEYNAIVSRTTIIRITLIVKWGIVGSFCNRNVIGTRVNSIEFHSSEMKNIGFVRVRKLFATNITELILSKRKSSSNNLQA